MSVGINNHILWITRTSVFIALLLAAQFVTAPLSNSLLTGSIVNLILILALLTCGPATGFTAGVLSPLCAALFGFGPAFPPLLPLVMAGNALLIAVWFALGRFGENKLPASWRKAFRVLTVPVAAFVKFLWLYLSVTRFAIPLLLQLNEKQSAMITLAFSYPQLITATIGGVLALLTAPLVQKAIRR